MSLSAAMLKNYIKTALRNLKKYHGYSFINIVGLAVGLACFLVIMLHVRFQLSYDRYHENADRIYATPHVPALLAQAVKEEFPEVEEVTRMSYFGGLFRHESKYFTERTAALTDPSIFRIFQIDFIYGNPESALNDLSSIVITESAAEKYFGKDPPIGKTLTYENRLDFVVAGVVSNLPENTEFGFDFLINFRRVNDIYGWNCLNSWGAWNYPMIVLLRENGSIRDIEEKMPDLLSRRAGEEYAEFFDGFQNPTEEHIKSSYLPIYSAIAVFILIVACINFMNLASAHSLKRTKEVGIRKVVGAYRTQLIKQFIGESIILTLLALPLAVLLIGLSLPYFESQFGLQGGTAIFSDERVWIGVFLITVVIGIVSGSYPALFASTFQPIKALSGKKSINRKSVLRNCLVVFQFAISIILILSTLVISRQIEYMRNKNLGINQECIVNLPSSRDARAKYETMRNELLRHPQITQVTRCGFTVGMFPSNQSVEWEGQTEDDDDMMHWIAAGNNFVKTFEMELIQGRDFSEEFPSDVYNNYILNETAVKAIEWEDPIGKRFQILYGDNTAGVVVGVVKDFHYKTLHHKVQPLAIYHCPESCFFISLRIASDDIENTIQIIKNTWEEMIPSRPFTFSFLDERFDRIYRHEQRWKKMFSCFASLSIIVACMGLFGLASFMAEQRTKEVGIRKVLGASVTNIAALISRDFLVLVVISNAIALPVGYFIMRWLLDHYAYRIEMKIWIFIVSALATILISLFTVSFKAVRTAMGNPVDSLRYE
jgi:putative ABC transport system permease protein